jgi:hypothetical protein
VAVDRNRVRAQRRLARELKDIREGRAEWRKSSAGRAYDRALVKMSAPILVIQHAHDVFGGSGLRWSPGTVAFNVNRMTVNQRTETLTFSLSDWQYFASIQSAGNVWWYHKSSDEYLDTWRDKPWTVQIRDARAELTPPPA